MNEAIASGLLPSGGGSRRPDEVPLAEKTARGSTARRTQRWPWLFLVLALAWSALIRVPLILNSDNHLDSDLAVDGLTLLEATKGHFSWHYPGTPYMGATTVVLSLPQAMIWGANPTTLVSGGTVAYLGLIVAVFLLAWRAFGPICAVFSLVPLAFASIGAVWLSGRITGGHLAAAVFHAGLFLGFASWLKAGRPSRPVAFILGLWSGIGLYTDSMFALSLVGFGSASFLAWLFNSEKRRGLALAATFGVGLLLGVAPREIGSRRDPSSAYEAQFQLVTDKDILVEHAKLLGRDCLPRLFGGHRLPRFETEPDPRSISGPSQSSTRSQVEPLGIAVSLLSLSLGIASFVALTWQLRKSEWPLALGLLISTAAALAAFITNRNIYNSDNYRYLVTLLVPAALGFGLLMRGFWASRSRGRSTAIVLCGLFAVLMTVDLVRWYHQFGWVDNRAMAVKVKVDDPTLAWLEAHPEYDRIFAGYWDVYRLIFLSGGRLKGSPYPIYPDRFPSWKRKPGEREVLLARALTESKVFVDRVLARGGKMLGRHQGINILNSP